jgi:hypothetical protein
MRAYIGHDGYSGSQAFVAEGVLRGDVLQYLSGDCR